MKQSFSAYIKKHQYEDRNPLSVVINDKICVKDYVDDRLGIPISNELFAHRLYAGYNVGECLSAIEKPCVVRLNNGWHIMKILLGCNDIITRRELVEWQNMPRKSGEWAPRQIKPGFTVERILPLKHNLLKFFVFHGRVEYVWNQLYDVSSGKPGRLLAATMYNRNWSFQNVRWNKNNILNFPRPARLDEMIDIAEKLFSLDYKFMRIDLYYNDNRIRLSEIMNLHAGGTNGFSGDFDYVLGALL